MKKTWISHEELNKTALILIKHGAPTPPKGSAILTSYERTKARLYQLDKKFQAQTGFSFQKLQEALSALPKGSSQPKKGTALGDAVACLFKLEPRVESSTSNSGRLVTDKQLKDILLTLAECGAPKPPSRSALGIALKRFTTPPEPDNPKDRQPDRIGQAARSKPKPPAAQPPVEGDPEISFLSGTLH